jgi:hypothetical protein
MYIFEAEVCNPVGGWLEAMVEVGRRVFPGGTSNHDLAPAHKMSSSFLYSC